MNLKNKTLKSVKWTTAASLVNSILQLIQLAILARYLDVEAFGLIAIIMIVIGFANMFNDFGVSSAIIHHQNISKDDLSSLYWFNILIGLLLFGIVFLVSPFVASFYNNDSLNQFIVLTSSVIFIQAFGKQFFTLLEKELHFNTIAKIEIFANIIGFFSAVFFALNNYQIYALIYPLIIVVVLKTIIVIYIGTKFHKPNLCFNYLSIKKYIKFGMYQMGGNVINYFNTQLDVIIIGKIFGTETLGFYSVAKQLVMRPIQIINPIVTRVLFPSLSKIQDDIPKVGQVYKRIVFLLSSVNFPIYIAFIVSAPYLIEIFLGNSWIEMIYIFQILSLYAMIRSVGNPVGSLILARGKPEYGLYMNLVIFLFTPVFIFFGTLYGIEGVSWSLVVFMVVLFYLGWYFLIYKLTNISFKDYLCNLNKPLYLSIISGIIAFSINYIFETSNTYLSFFAILTIGFLTLSILYYLFNKEFLLEVKNVIKS
jgi:O-antigen/teichoic acid export membrane protein